VQRDAQCLGLVLVRHGRLDRLHAARDLDPVPTGQEIVERVLVEVAPGQAGHEALGDVERLDRHRLLVGEPESRRDQHRLRRRDVEAAAEVRAGELRVERERPRAGAHPPLAHVLAERRHRQLLGDLRLAHERPGAAAPDEVALSDELVEGGAHGQPRDAEVGAELPLGGDRAADAHALDEVEDLVAGLRLLRDPLGGGGCHVLGHHAGGG
jgi:hypothetical protein